jgi:hypothetical protein
MNDSPIAFTYVWCDYIYGRYYVSGQSSCTKLIKSIDRHKGSMRYFEKIEIWKMQLQRCISLPESQRYMFSEKD